jgi:hypothetical protein
MSDHKVWYVVSDSETRVEPVDEETPTHYNTPEEATAAILSGYHGEYGTRYVLAVDVSLVSTYDRAWELRRKDA